MPVGAGAATAVAAARAPPPPPAAAARLAAAAAGERGLALARTLEQVRGDAALVFGDRVAGVGRGRPRPLRPASAALGVGVGGASSGAVSVVAVVTLDGKTERLAALAAALEEMFGNFGHGVFASLRA